MSEQVTWDELVEWAKEHGALTDRIVSISIDGGRPDGPVVRIMGHELNESGRPFEARHNEAAKWQVERPLRRFP